MKRELKALRRSVKQFIIDTIDEEWRHRAFLERKRGQPTVVHFEVNGVTFCGHRSATSDVSSEPHKVTCSLCWRTLHRFGLG